MAFKLGNEKQWKWRSIGFVGFSFLAHAGLITALIAQPQSTSSDLGVASGNGGDTSMVEVGDSGASADQLSGETAETVAMATQPGNEQTGEVAVAPVTAPAVKTDVVTTETVKPVMVEKTAALPEKKKSAPVKKSTAAASLPAKANTPTEPESLSPEISEDANTQDQSFIPTKDESAVETVSATTSEAPVLAPESLQPEIADEESKPTEEAKPELAKPIDQPALVAKEEATPQQDLPTEEVQPSAVEATKDTAEETPKETNLAPAPVTEAAMAPTSTTSAKESTDTPAGSPTQSEKAGDDLIDQTSGPGKDTNGQGATDAGKGLGAVGTSTGGRTGLYGIPQGTKIKDAGLRVPLAGNKNPIYPETERLSRTEGTAILVGQVKSDGKISQVFVERSSGSKSLDQAAMKAFAKWKYQPGSEEYLRQPFAFKLSGEPEIFRQRVGQNQQ